MCLIRYGYPRLGYRGCFFLMLAQGHSVHGVGSDFEEIFFIVELNIDGMIQVQEAVLAFFLGYMRWIRVFVKRTVIGRMESVCIRRISGARMKFNSE